MTCYKPLQAYRSIFKDRSGKNGIIFRKDSSYLPFSDFMLPCGRCIGCRIDRSRQWAARCVHEASLHECNSFITLTYADEHLPPLGSLVKSHFQKFMKRLRDRVFHYYSDLGMEPPVIRYYHCGEYGEQFARPHYHACIFGFDFPDKIIWRVSPSGSNLYRSALLEDLWKFGHSSVGDVTFESAAYVARYVLKKFNGDLANYHYGVVCKDSGEYLGKLQPEYTTMSRRPGIGRDWYDQFKSDIYNEDRLVLSDGQIMRPPRYYDNLFEIEYPSDFANLKARRIKRAKSPEVAMHSTPERLAVREECQSRSVNRLIRSLEIL